MKYALISEKFRLAVEQLVGDGPMQARFRDAVEKLPTMAELPAFPEELRDDYQALYSSLFDAGPEIRLARPTDSEAASIARKLVMLYHATLGASYDRKNVASAARPENRGGGSARARSRRGGHY